MHLALCLVCGYLKGEREREREREEKNFIKMQCSELIKNTKKDTEVLLNTACQNPLMQTSVIGLKLQIHEAL